MKKTVFKVILLIIISLLSSYLIYDYAKTESVDVDKNIEHVDLDGYNKLMIVAHPDDDIIWGGSHLIDDDYLVVCITCGESKTRVEEFTKVMDSLNDRYLMLGYPDKTNGKRDNWKTVYSDITANLKGIVEYKDWEVVVTHNPEGEYGHEQHKMTNKIVTSITNHNKLYYFGKYYTRTRVPEDLGEISKDNYDFKVETLVPLYASQKIVKPYGHMLNHENWVSYTDWID